MAAGIIENQMTRYGAIAKYHPLTTGKTFFLMSSTEAALPTFLSAYPVDGSGQVRVYTTWASVIAACQAVADADVIIVSPLFTTPPTKAQQLQLDACGVVTLQAGTNLPDGSYIAATQTALSLAATTTNTVFGVNGRVLIDTIIGEVVTTIGATQNAKFTNLPTVGSTTDLCAVGSTGNLPVGAQFSITGTLANALVTTVQSVYIKQATPIIATAGTLELLTSATTTGNVKIRLTYKPLDPGAFVYPLI